MASRPFPDTFRGRISFPRQVVITGDISPVYDVNGIMTHWLIKTGDRELPTKVPVGDAIVEPYGVKKFESNAPVGKKRGH